jgi:hypothetical protein
MRSSYACLSSHPSEKVTRARHDESTSNLVRHAENCDPSSASLKMINLFANAYTPGKFRVNVALWISRRHRPFMIVEDPKFVELLTSLNNKVSVPSRATLTRDIHEIFAATCLNVATLLQVRVFSRYFADGTDHTQNSPGKLHLCFDGWTSPNIFSFVGITVHWVADGQIHTLILDFVKCVEATCYFLLLKYAI